MKSVREKPFMLLIFQIQLFNDPEGYLKKYFKAVNIHFIYSPEFVNLHKINLLSYN